MPSTTLERLLDRDLLMAGGFMRIVNTKTATRVREWRSKKRYWLAS